MGFGSNLSGKVKKHECDVDVTVPLSNYSGMKIGVDASVWINRALKSRKFAKQIALAKVMIPEQSIKDYIWVWLDCQFESYHKYDIELLLVFDGIRNKLKAKENDKRSSIWKSALIDMEEHWNGGAKLHEDAFYKCAKNTIRVTDDVILLVKQWCDKKSVRYVCAPMEAEWELVYLCNEDVIDGIVSSDSDILALGRIKFVIYNLSDYGGSIWVDVYTAELIGLYQKEVLNLDMTSADDTLSWIVYCVMHGCDFVSSAPGIGPVKVEKAFKDYMKCDSIAAKELFFDELWDGVPLLYAEFKLAVLQYLVPVEISPTSLVS